MNTKIVFLKDQEVHEVVGGIVSAPVAVTRNGGNGVIRVLLVAFLGPLGAAIFSDLSRIGGVERSPTTPGRPISGAIA